MKHYNYFKNELLYTIIYKNNMENDICNKCNKNKKQIDNGVIQTVCIKCRKIIQKYIDNEPYDEWDNKYCDEYEPITITFGKNTK